MIARREPSRGNARARHGGTSGIGEAIVGRLRSEGAGVAFTGRSSERGERVAARTGGRFVRADATIADDVDRSVSEAVAELGGLNAVVLNAAVLHEGPLAETTDEVWDAILETNVLAPYRYALACLPHLRAAGGSIVAMSSDAGVWVEPAVGAYSVSKRALIVLAQMLGTEAGKDGMRVNAVCPGDTAPGMATFTTGRTERDPSGWLLPPAGRIGTAAGRSRPRSPSSSRPTPRSATARCFSSTAACAADLHSTSVLNG